MPDFGGNVTAMIEFSELLEIGLNRVIAEDLPTHPKLYETWLVEKTAKEFVEDEMVVAWFGAMPEKTIGGPFTVDKPVKGTPKEFTLVPHGLSAVLEYELIRWDQYMVFKKVVKMLNRSGVDRKNVISHAILNNSITSTDPVFQTYKGENLVDVAHTLLKGGTSKNQPSSPVGLTYLGLQEAITDFRTIKTEEGFFGLMQPKNLVVPSNLKWVGETLIKSDYRPDNANRSYNTVYGRFDCIDSPYLTSTTRWWLLASKDQLEIAFVVGDDLTPRRDFEESTWNNVYSMYASFRAHVMDWKGIWGTEGV